LEALTDMSSATKQIKVGLELESG